MLLIFAIHFLFRIKKEEALASIVRLQRDLGHGSSIVCLLGEWFGSQNDGLYGFCFLKK